MKSSAEKKSQPPQTQPLTLQRFEEISRAHRSDVEKVGVPGRDSAQWHRGELLDAYQALHHEHYRLVAATVKAASALAGGVEEEKVPA